MPCCCFFCLFAAAFQWDISAMMASCFMAELLFTTPHTSAWTSREELLCQRANTSPERLFTSLLTANNALFQEVCLSTAFKTVGKKEKEEKTNLIQMKDLVTVWDGEGFSNNDANFVWRIQRTLSLRPECENQPHDSPAEPFISKQKQISFPLPCDPVSMVIPACPPAAAWAPQPCSTLGGSCRRPSCR